MDRIAAHVAVGPVGLEAVALDRGDVGRVRRLDTEAAHVRRCELDGDVVLFRAQHRLGAIGDADGEAVVAAGAGEGGGHQRHREQEGQNGGAEQRVEHGCGAGVRGGEVAATYSAPAAGAGQGIGQDGWGRRWVEPIRAAGASRG